MKDVHSRVRPRSSPKRKIMWLRKPRSASRGWRRLISQLLIQLPVDPRAGTNYVTTPMQSQLVAIDPVRRPTNGPRAEWPDLPTHTGILIKMPADGDQLISVVTVTKSCHPPCSGELEIDLTSLPLCSKVHSAHPPSPCSEDVKDCLFVCGISLTSGQLISELFPDCTRSCFSQVVSRRRGGDRIYEMRCPFVAVGPNARFIVLPHWDNMS